jgi:hypothetical protein
MPNEAKKEPVKKLSVDVPLWMGEAIQKLTNEGVSNQKQIVNMAVGAFLKYIQSGEPMPLGIEVIPTVEAIAQLRAQADRAEEVRKTKLREIEKAESAGIHKYTTKPRMDNPRSNLPESNQGAGSGG